MAAFLENVMVYNDKQCFLGESVTIFCNAKSVSPDRVGQGPATPCWVFLCAKAICPASVKLCFLPRHESQNDLHNSQFELIAKLSVRRH